MQPMVKVDFNPNLPVAGVVKLWVLAKVKGDKSPDPANNLSLKEAPQ
ncbi:MAG: hypothetical protein HC898_11940 [Phycisphaerales bacterium]|nr:hypothetical protein [Phycisphaerales bacterium]